MKLVAISKRAGLILLVWCIFIFGTGTDDFINGEKAFNKNEYRLAEIYFSHLLADEPYDEHVPDAVYYLAKIHGAQGNFIDMITQANRFLEDFKYDIRGKEIFNLVLTQLDRAKAYCLALEYIKRYDYLIDDLQILERIGNGLFEQNRLMLADYIFSLCPQTDTIKIVRAAAVIDNTEKKQYYESIGGVKGKLYLIEHYLEIGDTIEAYVVYKLVNGSEVSDTELYRYSKVSRLFDEDEFIRAIKQLVKLEGFFNKSHLLNALNTGHYRLANGIYHQAKKIPFDQEECVLLTEYVFQDTISRKPPDFIHDSLSEDQILLLREETKSYFLDSLYAEKLIGSGETRKALTVILPYIFYSNTKDFVRTVRGQYYYEMKEYETTANEIILSRSREPGMLFILADALKNLDRKYDFLLAEILNTSKDSVLLHRSVRELIIVHFANGEYDDVANYEFEAVQGDTTLMKIFLYSLARTGRKEEADSLFNQFFIGSNYELINSYGEFLINKKKYQKARNYYDSIIHSTEDNLPDRLYYNWALIPFLQGKVDTALYRFQLFFDDLKKDEIYAKTSFKIATIKYLNHEFDSAAYYYSLASKDDALRLDALQNQLICYKKYGNWPLVIETGRKILPLTSGDEEVEMQFEIGYGFLRSGHTREAVDYLTNAAKSKPSPAFYYWLAEAYVAKGDFSRALYQYLRIVDLFPADEMWTPTAEYKTGIAFELMEEFEEAKKVYNGIIRRRGAQDTWGIEAQKRLEIID